MNSIRNATLSVVALAVGVALGAGPREAQAGACKFIPGTSSKNCMKKKDLDKKSVSEGKLDKLVGFETLLALGSPRAFDLGIDAHRDIAKKQILSQLWNNWGVAVRQDPRFKKMANDLGYVDFWRKFGWPDRCAPTGPDDYECI